MRGLAVALLLAAAARSASAASAPRWSVEADSAPVVGQETLLRYRAVVEPGARLAPDALASQTTSFAVVAAKAEADGSWTWTVLPLDEGRLLFTARWTLDGAPVAAPEVELDARPPALPKDADIADIKGPLAARRAVWPWILAALIGAAAWETWRRAKARPRPARFAPAAPPVPADLAAAHAIADLRASGLWERGEHAAFYLRLTDIVREYLENRYKEPATAMTSAEVARLVKAKESDLKWAALTRELLSRADLVKFARSKPAADEGPRDADAALELVRATTPEWMRAPELAAADAAGAAPAGGEK